MITGSRMPLVTVRMESEVQSFAGAQIPSTNVRGTSATKVPPRTGISFINCTNFTFMCRAAGSDMAALDAI